MASLLPPLPRAFDEARKVRPLFEPDVSHSLQHKE